MREIKFSQHHRRTGERRRFVISQFVDAVAASPPEPVDDGPYLAAGPLAWHYIAQAGDTGPWTDFRRLDVASDAPDEDVRKKAARDLSSRVWERAPN